MAKGGKKTPSTGGIVPSGAKLPKIALHFVDGGPLAWRFSMCDSGGPYPWNALTPEKHLEVIEKLHEFEKRNWDEITRGGSHLIKVADCCKDARDRLEKTERDDFDTLVSFRLSATERVWCIQAANVMSVLWWDPDHQVYPVKVDKADRAKDKIKRR
jgi:hypothetical protein